MSFGVQAIIEITNDLQSKFFALFCPASGREKRLDTGAQAGKKNELWRVLEIVGEQGSEALKKVQFHESTMLTMRFQ